VIWGKPIRRAARMVLKRILVAGMLLPAALAQSPAAKAPAAPAPAAIPAKSVPTATSSRYRPDRFPKRAKDFYQMIWGIDSLAAKSAESGEVIRFSYRVLDPAKAKTLNDKMLEPYLLDERARVRLVIPALEKVGKLRQTSPPEAGKAYWMVFSNKGRLVKPGDRVNVVIGNFRANGLLVQ